MTEFEPDRVAVYGLGRDRSGYRLGWPEASMPGGRFHLVMEFDEHDVLLRYAIVDTQAELAR